jgi:Flp pilus assembly pilin Flp
MRSIAAFSARLWRDFRDDEGGQATSEYTLILVIIVAICLLVIKNFARPMYARLSKLVVGNIEKTFLTGDLHRFNVGR